MTYGVGKCLHERKMRPPGTRLHWDPLYAIKPHRRNALRPFSTQQDNGHRLAGYAGRTGVIRPKSRNPLQAGQIQMDEPAIRAADSL